MPAEILSSSCKFIAKKITRRGLGQCPVRPQCLVLVRKGENVGNLEGKRVGKQEGGISWGSV